MEKRASCDASCEAKVESQCLNDCVGGFGTLPPVIEAKVNEDDSDSSVGMIVGVVVGVAMISGLIAVAAGFMQRRAGAGGSAVLSESLMGAQHTSPLYEADMMDQINPLHQDSSL